MIEQEFPDVGLIRNDCNLYFARAHNQGIRASNGEFVLCLNNDIVLESTFIERLLERVDGDNCVGIWGGKILRMDRRTLDTTGMLFLKNRRPLERGYGQRDTGQFDVQEYVFGIGGAAMLLRRSMLEEIIVGGHYFDEDFMIFYDDLDLNWRAQRFGWKAFYVSTAIAYHHRGETMKQHQPPFAFLKKYYFAYLSSEAMMFVLRNRYCTIIKNDSLGNYCRNLLYIFAEDMRLLSYSIIFKPAVFLYCGRVITALLQACKKRRSIAHKLRHIQQRRQNNSL